MTDVPPSRQHDKRARDVATLVALAGLVLLACGLLALLALVLQQLFVLAIVVFVVAFGLYLGLHYVLWGRGLSQRIQEHPDSSRPDVEPAPETLPVADND
ncbi:MAG: hypothetical protein CMJ65_13610 [Planctomycetaceae bacterium]|jgi:membrane protein implicated in regulation of membrane protease activity|nr:hypothetical protein [Planctomycetaceae bacterium]MDP7274834.1 hypothetical protein [Planctomycetaceae bacterium]